MAQKDLDLRTLFARVKLKNTDESGNIGDSSFDTTDIAYLRSAEEVKNIPQEKRRKSLSDFALSNFAWQIESYTAENGNFAGAAWLRCANNSECVGYINPIGRLELYTPENKDFGLSVALDITTKSLISALDSSQHIKFTSKKVQKQEKHFIELGQYPGRIVSQELQKSLEEAYNGGNLKDGLTSTGRLYATNGQRAQDQDFLSKQNPEFEFNGEKYVRVVVWNGDISLYKDGTNAPTTGNVIWHKVEPISFEILNWDKLPRSINPKGKRFVSGAEA